MEWENVGKGLVSIAPTLASVIGGPPGVIVGGAIKVLSGFLGLSSDASPDDVSSALAQTAPADYVRLKDIDNDYKKQLVDAGIKLEEIAAGDRDSARKNQAATGSKTPDRLAFWLTAGFFTAVGCLMFIPVPDANKAIIFSMVGTLGTVWIGFMTYFSGTTAAGARKTEIIAQSAPIK